VTSRKTHTLQRRLAARRAIALLTGSHASLGLADRMRNFDGFRTIGQPLVREELRDRIIDEYDSSLRYLTDGEGGK
jgi:hypothetical protein